MKILLFSVLLAGGVAAFAQPEAVQRAEPIAKRDYTLEAPVVSSAQAQKLALPDDIKIHLQDVTLLRALQELELQSGLPLDLSPLSKEKLDTKMSIDIDTPSVTRALDAIADEANLKLALNHGHSYDTWHLRENTDKAAPRLAPAVVDELFETRLLKVDVSLFKQLDLDAAQPQRTQNDNLNLTLELSPDPGWPIGGLPVLHATRAEDDQGRSLIDTARAPEKLEYDAGFIDVWNKKNVVLQLRPPEPDARRIAHLEGEALCTVAVKRARWEVPDLLASDQQTYQFKIGEAEVTTTLSQAKIEDEAVRFELGLALPAGTSWQKFSGNIYSVYGVLKWLTLEDASGTRLIPSGGGGGSGSNTFSSAGYFVLPPAPPGQNEKRQLALPIRFVFEPPTDWVQAQVKFQFDDVPLP